MNNVIHHSFDALHPVHPGRTVRHDETGHVAIISEVLEDSVVLEFFAFEEKVSINHLKKAYVPISSH